MNRKKLALIAGIAVVLFIGAVVAAPFFLPKDTVRLDQDLPPSHADTMQGAAMAGDAMQKKREATEPVLEEHRGGDWMDGDSTHKASGRIDLVTVDGLPYLRFSDFEMTAGPDVYLYLTWSASPSSAADVEGDGVRIDVATDEDRDARLNERGTFFVPLELSVDELDQYQSAVAWCDDFNVIFGTAALA